MLLQEDVGNQAYLGGIWVFDPATGGLARAAIHDPARFSPGAASLLTQDEESSGIVPVDEILGRGWYLADVQAHYGTGDPETVEGGQLLAIHVPPGRPIR